MTHRDAEGWWYEARKRSLTGPLPQCPLPFPPLLVPTSLRRTSKSFLAAFHTAIKSSRAKSYPRPLSTPVYLVQQFDLALPASRSNTRC